LNVVDSSAWLEYFADGPNASFFAPAIEDAETLVIPTISLYEVFKIVARQRDETAALDCVAIMLQGSVVELSPSLAVLAARLSAAHKIPMADSILLATAKQFGATLWTQDADFQGIEGVMYRPR
jgi:toxin FitB